MKRLILIFPLLIVACATTPRGKARQTAVIQKTAVDGLGAAYLRYCTIIRKPKCVSDDIAATSSGNMQTQEQRVSCLRPCDSATATKIREGVDVVRVAQTALFHLIQKDDATEADLAESRAQLRHSSEKLLGLLEELGVMGLLGDAVGGLGG